MIDLIDEDLIVSSLVNNEIYLVGRKNAKGMYVCKRDEDVFYYMELSFNVSHTFCMSVVNKSHVRGIDRRTKSSFEDVVDFDRVSVKELIFDKIRGSLRLRGEPFYIKEYLSAEYVDFYNNKH